MLIDGLDGLSENDLLRSIDGIVGADLGLIDRLGRLGLIDGLGRLGLIDGLDRPGLMEGLVLPGLMDGLGRLGAIERFVLDPADPRLLLMRSISDPRFELPDCAMIDGLRRLGIDRPLR